MQYVIGIDGGGSSTRAVLADTSGVILGRGLGAASNVQHAGEKGMREAFSESVQGAFVSAGLPPTPAVAAFLGIAGATTQHERDAIVRAFRLTGALAGDKVGVSHDIHIALAGGLASGPGICLVAGTGSSCYGRSAGGETVQVGGWGFVADDAGGGGWLAREAIRLAARQADGRSPLTELRAAVFQFLKIESIAEILTATETNLPRNVLASLSPRIIELAEHGDSAAAELGAAGADALAEMIEVAARQLRLTCPEIVLAGGLAASKGWYQTKLLERIRIRVPDGIIREPILTPAGGAVLEALGLLDVCLSTETIRTMAHRL